MSRKCFLISAVLAVVLSACALSGAKAEYTYFDDFNKELNQTWWTMSSSGSVAASYVTDITNTSNKLILMKYTLDPGGPLPGEGSLKLNFPIQGNFSASITYNLYNWPTPDNDAGISIATNLGEVERISDTTELYLTDFVGDVTHSISTSDMQGRLRIIRNGTILQGCYYDPTISGDNKWLLISQYNNVSAADTNITISLWPGGDTDKGFAVIFDDFNLHAYDAKDPRGVVPEPASMLLFGVGAAAMAVIKRRKKNT